MEDTDSNNKRTLLKCPDCDRVFLKPNRLKEHSYVHTGIVY